MGYFLAVNTIKIVVTNLSSLLIDFYIRRYIMGMLKELIILKGNEIKMASKKMSGVKKKLTISGLLITMGIVYGDIGTSPLYVMKAIIEGNGGLKTIDESFILGAVSLIFWTVTLLTTIKYVLLALNADNHGEGGIFSLFVLVRKKSKYLIIPAIIGGAALLADGMLTPAVTVTTAIEGLRDIPMFHQNFGDNQQVIIYITTAIIVSLFLIQRFGTAVIGKAFGPIMFGWFTFIGVMGLYHLVGDFSVIRALNPYYAIELLFSPDNKTGIFILGSVFLATTGAEALYSDLGHVGKRNIRATWPYIKSCLILNYLGQAAWLLNVKDNLQYQEMKALNPFFQMIPSELMVVGVLFATVAAIIASQALISGSYTLVSEAIKLKLLPRLHIMYPSTTKGQLYIPFVNYTLLVGCLFIVYHFRTSAHMEAAYGLAITITMLMTTILLYVYLTLRKVNPIISFGVLIFFVAIEGIFFISGCMKFLHGGYVAVLIALVLIGIMSVWVLGSMIKERYAKRVSLTKYVNQLVELSNDDSVPLYRTNLVYLTDNLKNLEIDHDIMYSVLDRRLKRAKVYWFLNVVVTDDPFTQEYYVDMLASSVVVVQLRLGFRVNQDANIYLRQIVNDLMKEGKLQKQPQKYSTVENRQAGDFTFVLIQEEVPKYSQLSQFERLVMQLKVAIKRIAVSPARWFGLEYSQVDYERVPLVLESDISTPLTMVEVTSFENEEEE